MFSNNSSMIKFTIYFIASITVLGGAIIAPAMGAINLNFQSSDPTLVRLIMTIPGLFVIPCCFFTSYCCFKFGKKNVLLFALALYATAGCIGAFMPDIYSLLFTRALVGIGVGLLTPISQSLPADFFTGAEKETVVARASGSVSLGNCIFMPFSGFLASYSWNYSFFAYSVIFLIFLCVYFVLPKEFGVKKDIDNITTDSDDRIPFSVYLLCFSKFCTLAVMYLLLTNLAIIIDERDLGSPTVSGYALAFSSFTSFFVAYNLARFRSLFKEYVYCLIPLAFSINFMLVYFANSMTTIFIAQIFNAIAGGLFFPSVAIAIIKRVSAQKLVKAMSYLASCMFLGSFSSPIIYAHLPHITGYEGISGHFFSTSIFCALVALGGAIITAYLKKKA